MKQTIYNIVETIIESDDSLDGADRKAILAFCRHPVFPSGPADQRHAAPTAWLSPRQAAARLSVDLRTIQRWVSNGRLPSRKLAGCRRIPADALAEVAALPCGPNASRLRVLTHPGDSGLKDGSAKAG